MNIQTMLKVSVCFNSVLIFIVLYGISSGIVTHLSEEIKVIVFLLGVATFVQYCYIENNDVIWLVCCWYIEFKEIFMYVLECFGDKLGLGDK